MVKSTKAAAQNPADGRSDNARRKMPWSGSYNAGRGWIDLGTLDRTAATDYEVDEARGTPLGRTD